MDASKFLISSCAHFPLRSFLKENLFWNSFLNKETPTVHKQQKGLKSKKEKHFYVLGKGLSMKQKCSLLLWGTVSECHKDFGF